MLNNNYCPVHRLSTSADALSIPRSCSCHFIVRLHQLVITAGDYLWSAALIAI